MKRIFLIFLLFFPVLTIKAQIEEKGTPPSFSYPQLKNTVSIKTYSLQKLNIQKLKKEDEEFPSPLRYSISTTVNIDIKNDGVMSQIPGGTIWRYQIASENAISINLIISHYKLPPKASLYIYNPAKSIIHGAYTEKNNKSYGLLAIGDFPSNKIIIEYYEPENPVFSGSLIIGSIGQAYRDINELTGEEQATPENVGINCPEGDPYQLEKHAVARMIFNEGGSGFVCTGALINNTRNDGTPYFLTANHCISRDSVAHTLVTFFNYEYSDCNTGTSTLMYSLSGSSRKASNEYSDFSLLQLDETPPPLYKPYFAGWNALSDSIVNSGYCIHHPAGTQKKIAIDYKPIVTYPGTINWDNGSTTEPDTHWEAIFEIGYTEGGSSGSPLFDNHNRIIGQLHGGGTLDGYYGKLSVSWEHGYTVSKRLKQWLDPDDSGVKILNGYTPADNYPEADFYANVLQVCPGNPIHINNNSQFNPTSWKWTFDPANVTYYDNTSDTSKSPVVSFDTLGPYTVSLEADRDTLTSNRERVDYITADTAINVEINTIFNNLFTYGDLKNLNENFFVSAKGAEQYSWEIMEKDTFLTVHRFSARKDTIFLKLNDSIKVDSTFSFTAKVTGNVGSCTDTAESTFTILYPFNDDIQKAYPLKTGVNGPFTNQGATTQTNEPNPPDPAGACNTQHSWCQCDVSDTILDNSVWFTFLGPESGVAGVYAPGFDDQIAIYEADSFTDILSGDTSKFKILAANDDYYGTDSNFTALIEGVDVVPMKKYWLQLDGSACGTWGIFYIDLETNRIGRPSAIRKIKSNSSTTNSFIIFPNPAVGKINVQSLISLKSATITILSMEGKEIKTLKINYISPGEIIPLDLKEVTSGLYMIKITNKNKHFVTKFLIQ